MRRAGPLLLIAVAGCSAPQAEQVAPSQAAYLPPPPAETYEADYILVDKSERTLTLYSHGIAIERYTGLQLGGEPVGAKHFEGDQRTPEGWYTIDYRNPRSAYHLSLHISYPDAADRAYAAARGYSPGGEIFIHGQPNGLAEGRESGD
jgi:murein L,D-transpeptidase YafK